MRAAAALLALSVALPGTARAQQPAAPEGRVALRSLVPAGDPLAAHDLVFDASFARLALAEARSPDADRLLRIAALPAIAHILAHARTFDYDVPKDSPPALVEALLGPPERLAQRAAVCESSLAFFSGPMLADPHWVEDALRYLPAGFRYRGALFLTFGYDIGVALAPNASLNCTHPRFAGRAREILYYAIHELHHVGFMTVHSPPRVADLRTCADLARLVEYSTQMEGMAVLAAYPRRQRDGALADDPYYVALDDPARMARDLTSYRDDLASLEGRGAQPADRAAWAVITRMSSGERLWYRVGALTARRIEAARGRAALVDLVRRGPAAFRAARVSLDR